MTSPKQLISSIISRAPKRHGKAGLYIHNHSKQLLSLCLLTFCISLGTTLPAQDTIIMPRTGALSVELQPCKEYIILDPGGTADYPADCNSALFLWSSTEEDITIEGRYTVTAIKNSGEALPTFYAQTFFFDGDILQSRSGNNPIESNMTRTYPSTDDLSSFDSIGASTVMGAISQRAISGYSAIFFQSAANQPGAAGFVLRVRAGTGSNPSADNVSVSSLTSTSATLSWRDLSQNNSGWTIRYDTTSYNLRSSIHSSSTSATITNLRPNTKYYYAISNNLDDPNGEEKGCASPMGSFITPAVPSGSGCLDFLDLESEYAHCYSGNYADPKVKEGIIDFGQDSIASRHTVVTTPSFDARAFNGQDYLRTIPDGESASIRLGNWQIGAQSECVTYQYTVDTNKFDLLLLKYAVVLQEPNHAFEQQPMFLLTITDEHGNSLNTDCYTAYFVPGLNTDNWNVGNQPNILWKDWSTIGVDLSPLQGRTIYINLITRDCLEAAHYGYAYYVMKCGRKEVDIASCGNQVENTFTPPEGFGYRWYKADNKNVTLSQERVLNVSSEGTYLCDLSFLGASGNSQCNFTMRAIAGPHHPYAQFDLTETDHHIDPECKTRALFKNNSIITRDEAHQHPTLDEGGIKYQWIIDSIPYPDEPSYFDFTEGTHTVSLIASLSDHSCADTLTRSFHIGGFCPVADRDTSFVFCDTITPVSIYDTTLNLPGTHTIDSANHSRRVTITLNHSIVEHVTDNVPLTELPDYSYLGFRFTQSVDTILYRHRQVTADGCDSLLRFSLLVCDNRDTTIFHQVCDNAWPYERDNQSFSSAGQYSYTVPTNCGADRTVNLHLQEIESYHVNFYDTICQGQTSTIIGTGFNSEGTHTLPMQSRLGCDSVEVLYLVVRPRYDDTDRHTICVGDTLRWIDSIAYIETLSPAPAAHYSTVYGCDSTITLHLIVSNGLSDTISLFKCDSFSWHGVTYTESTTAEHTDSTLSRCGNTTHLNLTIGHSTTGIDIQDHCDSFYWYGERYTESTNTPTHKLTNAVNCDSIVTLNLTIRQSTSGIDTQIHCDNYTWPYNGVYYSVNNYNYTFYYANQRPVAHITNVAGCDSALTLYLTLHSSTRGIATYVECYNFSWHGRTYHRSNDTATYHTRNNVGCDSVVTLQLVILDSIVTIRDTACDHFTWRGKTYYYDTTINTYGLTNYRGCNYRETLILKINYSNQYDDVISACDSFRWHGLPFTTSNHTVVFDTINAAGCDSATNLRLSMHYSSQTTYYDTICDNQVLSQSGQNLNTEGTHRIPLHDIYGCDSVEIIHLKVWPAFDIRDSHAVCRGDTLGWINGIAYTAIDDTLPHINFISSHGCDSIVSLALTIHDTAYGRQSIYVHEDSMPTFRYNGAAFSDNVTDTIFHLVSAVGCDSLLRFTLRVCYNHDTTIRRNVCANKYPFSIHSHSFDTAGTHLYKISTFCGADSNITLILSEKPVYRTPFYDTICDNQTFTQSGKVFRYNGTHEIRLRTVNNCDSIEEIHLKVWPTFTQNDRHSICRGDTLLWEENGLLYSDVPSPTPDTTYPSQHGCDSTIRLALSVHEHTYNYVNATVIENNLPGYQFNNVAFDTDVADTLFILSNVFGCDSFLHFSLHVARNHDTSIRLSICSGEPATFVINGIRNTFRNEDTTRFVIQTHEGADSTISIISEFFENSEVTVYDTICDAIQNGLGTSEVLRQRRDIGQTIHLCDSITKILTTVRPINITNFTEIVPENNLPHTYHNASFADDVADSVFRLANRWECDSLVHYTMIVCRNTDTTIFDTICDTQAPHAWNGVTFTETAVKHAIIPTHCGADSSLTMHLRVKASSTYDDIFSACDSFLWHGRLFTTSNHTDTVISTNAVGCDSTTTLRLTIHYSYLITYHDTICDNQTFSQSGQTFNTEGTHIVTFSSIHNCDSIEEIHLKVWPTLAYTDIDSICRGDTLLWQDGNRYPDMVQPAPYVVLTSQHGCDSTVTLSLTVRGVTPSYHSESLMITENELPTFRYNNASFASDVSDTVFKFINAVGCDSILHFSLSVCRNVDSSAQRNICDNELPLHWNDTTFIKGETLALHRLNHCGADSIVILTVNVRPTYNITRYDTICDNQELIWGGQTLTTPGTYGIYRQSVYACDSSERLHLTVCPTYDTTDHIILCWGTTLHWIDGNDYTYRPLEPPVAFLKSQYGCDSIHTLDLLKTHPISSNLTVTPEHPTWENPEIQITDISRNNISRQWYISNQFLDTSKTVTYRFTTTSDVEALSEIEAIIKLIVFDEYGCTDTLTRRIHFDRSGLWVPNLITPNRIDNNVMRIEGVGINELECYVYTRQGQFIYKFNSINDVWDGTYNGTLCPQATYTYVIHYTTIHDPKSWLTKKGTITLLR